MVRQAGPIGRLARTGFVPQIKSLLVLRLKLGFSNPPEATLVPLGQNPALELESWTPTLPVDERATKWLPLPTAEAAPMPSANTHADPAAQLAIAPVNVNGVSIPRPLGTAPSPDG